jgi:cytochrome c2
MSARLFGHSLVQVLALALLAGCQDKQLAASVQGDPARGRIALAQHACRACHMIPGVTGSETYVGRPLENLAERRFIAGVLPNTQANLVRWIRDPKSVDPRTAMPTLGVSERDALDMSAWLLTAKQ